MVSAEPAVFEDLWSSPSSKGNPDRVETNHETPRQVHCSREIRDADREGVATVTGNVTVCSDSQQRHEATRSRAAQADNLAACNWGGAVW